MANTISNMRMTNPIKGLVSKRRKRYTKDGFNLDLAYILPNLIAMGFPAERLESVYRNNIDDVYKFLESKHNGLYKIYNLCSERSYDRNKFHCRVAEYPFDDHNPPNIELIQNFCDDIHKWLSANERHVAAVHCKAGKGRTGTMISCYMLHIKKFTTADDALSYYGLQRTHDKKGVTIPSQRRYVEYYARLLQMNKLYAKVSMQICEIKLSPPPLLNSHQGLVHYSISDRTGRKLFASGVPELKKIHGSQSNEPILITLDRCIPLVGDVKVEFYSKNMMGKEKMFHFWFNTFFANEEEPEGNISNDTDSYELLYRLSKYELDDAHKDKQHKIYPPDFEVQLKLQRIPSASAYTRGESHLLNHNQNNHLHHNNHHLTNNHHSNHHSNHNHINMHTNSTNSTSTTAVATGALDDSLSPLPCAQTPSETSEASSSEASTEEDGWESVGSPDDDSGHRPVGRYRLLSESDNGVIMAPDSHNNLLPA